MSRDRFMLVLFTCVALVVVVMLAAVTNYATFNQLNVEATLIEGEPPPVREEPEINGSLQCNLYRTNEPLRLPIEYMFFALLLTVFWLLFTDKGRAVFVALGCILLFIFGGIYYDSGGIRIKRSERTERETVLQNVVSDQGDWMTDWLTWGVAILVSLVVLGVLYWAWKRWFDRPPAADDELATVAQNALAELDAGASLEDVIQWSYEAMQTAVGNRRQLNRRVGMTVREFEERLIANGLPVDAVGNLSRLFERVRYGNYMATVRDEQVARSALQAIVAACGGTI